ncbi:glycoside hydrolase family 6 protein [Rarobacter incanus]|uniref:Glucanase n=1 Tax=Rarobacter incanus TaxID=153494 RepID=A0A542SQ63_9MICO|nr:glycoside hydrolase family 6 protein [Rarobacter incanus]TQK76718.1 endoglucanase [Rarobacter incanus]
MAARSRGAAAVVALWLAIVACAGPALTPAAAALPARVSKQLYVDPDSQAAAAARTATGVTGRAVRYIAKTPQARWVGDWNPIASVRAQVRAYLRGAHRAGATGVLVLYAIPGRDCGSYSAGGFAASDYKRWVRQVAKAVRGYRPIVVVEPDALMQDCATAKTTRLVAWAAKTLSRAGAWVYLDGGHSQWRSPADTARRLRAAGIKHARGFFTNVSNFNATARERRYARLVARQLKAKGVTAAHRHAIIDVSRNGRGAAPGNQWCNPAGRGLGERPRLVTGSGYLDALLWIKAPGESDGTCQGWPAAGTFSPALARGLYKNRR